MPKQHYGPLKWLCLAVLLWLCALLQGYAPLRIWDTRPQLLAMLAVCVAIYEGAHGGAAFAFFAGLMTDALHPHTTAFFAVLFMLAGTLTGLSAARLFRRTLFTALLWAALTVSSCTLLYWFFFQLMSGRGGVDALLSVGLSEVWISLLFCPLLYPLVKVIHTHFSEPTEVNPWKERA